MWQLFIKGGPVMYLLFFCSLVGVYIIVEKLLYLKVNCIENEYITDKIKNRLVTSGREQTLRELRTERKLMLRVLSSAIKFAGSNREAVEEGVKEVTYQEIPKLEKNMNILSSIITVAPILGLLGTVLGLMDVFNVISGGNLGDAAALSAGIAEALITTVTGLSIAIPFIFLNQYLSYRIEIFILTTERLVNQMISFCNTHGGVKP
ncbi:MAG: MotA/TolQ/ExbB proton channel family protein [bacterium]|nr:MotA/TolQ/ExbB proton channel family protein [bacterium]